MVSIRQMWSLPSLNLQESVRDRHWNNHATEYRIIICDQSNIGKIQGLWEFVTWAIWSNLEEQGGIRLPESDIWAVIWKMSRHELGKLWEEARV